MKQPIPKPPKKEKKSPKPIAKIGKRGALKIAWKRKALDNYFESFGWQTLSGTENDGEMQAACQLCSFNLLRSQADFAHKKRASQGGRETLENGVAAHRLCHSYSHTRRDLEDLVTDSPANLINGQIIQIPEQLRLDLLRYLGFNHL